MKVTRCLICLTAIATLTIAYLPGAPVVRAQDKKAPAKQAKTPEAKTIEKAEPAKGDEKKPIASEHLLMREGELFLDAYWSSLDVGGSLGAQVAAADQVLRAQLGLPKDQGVVVTSVEEGGPADTAGLQKHDILLTASGKPLASPDALQKQLNEAGPKAVPITLLRGGKRLTIEVTPRESPWRATTFLYSQSPGLWIGVSVAGADETLRAQLRLPEKRGLVVTKVEADAPAAKAGLLVHDVLLEFGGKPLATIEDLNAQIQEVGEKPATMKLIRNGQAQSLQVTPAARPGGVMVTPVDVHWHSLGTVRFSNDAFILKANEAPLVEYKNPLTVTPPPADAKAELAELVKEVRKLNERIEALDRSLKAADEKAAKEKGKK